MEKNYLYVKKFPPFVSLDIYPCGLKGKKPKKLNFTELQILSSLRDANI